MNFSSLNPISFFINHFPQLCFHPTFLPSFPYSCMTLRGADLSIHRIFGAYAHLMLDSWYQEMRERYPDVHYLPPLKSPTGVHAVFIYCIPYCMTRGNYESCQLDLSSSPTYYCLQSSPSSFHRIFLQLLFRMDIHSRAKRMHVGKFGAHSNWRSHISRSTAPISNIKIDLGRWLGKAFTIVFRHGFNQFRPCYRWITEDGNLAKFA